LIISHAIKARRFTPGGFFSLGAWSILNSLSDMAGVTISIAALLPHWLVMRIAPPNAAPQTLLHVGLSFHHSQPVTLLKSINGARQVLCIQYGDQSAECFFGIVRSRLKGIRR
jgi:hypothetical protein